MLFECQQAYDQDEWDSDFDESEDQQAMPPPSGTYFTQKTL